jgi:hypothetical protein
VSWQNNMKKNILTEKIMDNVVSFEKKRSRNRFAVFIIVILALIAVLLIAIYFFNKSASETGSYDLFTLLSQDKEIIADYWQDTIMVFWEEVPQGLVILIFLCLISIISYILISRRKLRITRKKLESIDKYEKTKIIDRKG